MINRIKRAQSKRDDFSSNRHRALTSCWRMIFSENRYPPRIKCGAGFFGIMRVATRRWGLPAIVALAATAALTALSADAGQLRRAAPTEATAPRDAGEPIMAIVSIKSQQVTFYDADGWIMRAPPS